MNKICGIYKITSPTGKVYIGQSRDIKTRWQAYKNMGGKIKSQPKIYNSLKKYSPDNHVFEILEFCNIEELNVKEDYWQNLFEVFGKHGLNCMSVDIEGKPRRHSQESKDKARETKKNKLRPLNKTKNNGRVVSDEQKERMRVTIQQNGGRSGDKNPMYGKVGCMNPNFGKKYPETGKKISERQTGEKNHNAVVVLDTETGTFYGSIKEASKAYDIYYPHLVLMLRGAWKNKTNLIRC